MVFLNKQGKEESITFKLVEPLDGPLIDKRLKEALKKLAESINQTKSSFGAPTPQKGSFFTSKGSNFGILPKKDPPKTDLNLSTEKTPAPETKTPETKAPETSSEPKGFFKTKKEKEQEKKKKKKKIKNKMKNPKKKNLKKKNPKKISKMRL